MAHSFVKVTKIQSSTGSSCSGSVSSTAGNALICFASCYAGATTGSNLAASGGGTWTSDVAVIDTNDANNKFKGLIASCPSATGGAQTITVSNGQANGVTAAIKEFSGNATANLLAIASPAVAVGTSTAPATNAQTNVETGDLFVAMVTNADGANPATVTGTKDGWTYPSGGQETNGSTFQTLGTGYRVAQKGESQTSTWTTGNFRWDALIAVYKTAPVLSGGARPRPWTQLRPAPFKPGGERPTAFRRTTR